MSVVINDRVCRCCATEGTFKDLKTKYHWMGDEEIYSDMLKDCFDIGLALSDDVQSNGICEVCITQLRNAANFKRQVLHTEEQFKSHLGSKGFKESEPSFVKIEVPLMQEEGHSDSDNDNDIFSEECSAEYEMPIKEEMEEPKPKKRATRSTATSAKKVKLEGETSKSNLQRNITQKKADQKPKVVYNVEYLKPKDKDELTLLQENVSLVLKYSNATPMRYHSQYGFACCHCESYFMKPQELKTHTFTHDSKVRVSYPETFRSIRNLSIKLDVTGLQCSLCKHKLASYEAFLRHLNLSHQIKMYEVRDFIVPFEFETSEYQCQICKQEFEFFRSLQTHMNKHYFNYVCDFCGSKFINHKLHIDHVKVHKSGIFKCEFCHNDYPTCTSLRDHKKYAHSRHRMVHKCPNCGESFKRYLQKIKHMSLVHDIHAAIECQICGKDFSSHGELTAHTKTEHLNKSDFTCVMCDKNFLTQAELDKHNKVHYTEIFRCQICNKNLATKAALNKHINRHVEKQLTCEYCGEMLLDEVALRDHINKEHDEQDSTVDSDEQEEQEEN